MTEPTPGQKRTAAARAARTGAKLQRMAETLRAAGWTVTSPEEQQENPNGDAY